MPEAAFAGDDMESGVNASRVSDVATVTLQLPFRFRSFNSSEFRSFCSVPLKTGGFRGIARL